MRTNPFHERHRQPNPFSERCRMPFWAWLLLVGAVLAGPVLAWTAIYLAEYYSYRPGRTAYRLIETVLTLVAFVSPAMLGLPVSILLCRQFPSRIDAVVRNALFLAVGSWMVSVYLMMDGRILP